MLIGYEVECSYSYISQPRSSEPRIIRINDSNYYGTETV